MYWYIKYPLYIIALLALIGICGLLWRSCIHSLPRPAAVPPQPAAAPAAPPAVSPALPDQPPPAAGTPQAAPTAKPVPPGTGVTEDQSQLLSRARQQLEAGMLVAARMIAARLLNAPGTAEFSPLWRESADIVNSANRRLMNSSAPCPEKERYVVVRGDSLKRIADKKYISVGNLLRVNEGLRRDDGRDPIIHPGQAMLYIKGVWSIRVVKHEYILLLYRNGALYRTYDVSIGKENRTPTGIFRITDNIVNPDWWAPNGTVVPYGEPENILGTRWLKLTPAEGTDASLTSYGIHGTWDEKSIGTGASAGCVRMLNRDVEELFDFIPVAGGKTPAVRVVIEE